jgi:chromosome partitioning protein
MDNIYTWKEKMHLQDQEIIMFTSLLERNSLSQQIYATYLSQYAENIINTPIRRSVKFEEALMSRQTILEYAPTSPQAEEYYELIMEQWFRLNNCNPNSVAEVPSQKVVEV